MDNVEKSLNQRKHCLPHGVVLPVGVNLGEGLLNDFDRSQNHVGDVVARWARALGNGCDAGVGIHGRVLETCLPTGCTANRFVLGNTATLECTAISSLYLDATLDKKADNGTHPYL